MKKQSKFDIQLWTIQPIEWYEKLLKNGVIHGEKQFVDEYLVLPYHWMIKNMDERIGKRPFSECHPVWAWYQYGDSKRRKPDLRNTALLPRGTKGVRMEIRKKESEVLLSDFDLWHYVLNYWHIADSEEKCGEFDHLLECQNIAFVDKESYTLEIRQKIEQSWGKVLDLNYASNYTAYPFDEKSVQATFWTLSVDEVVKVEEFMAR